MNYIPNLKYKTTFCSNWSQNLFCQKGAACFFAHGPNDLRNIQDNQILVSAQNKAQLQYRPTTNYKTIFCKFYSKGLCKLGQACTYAHERREKKKRSQQQEYQPVENYYPYYYQYQDGSQWYPQYGYQQYTQQQDYYVNDTYVEQVTQTLKESIETACEQVMTPRHSQNELETNKGILQNISRSNSINDALQLEINQIKNQ